MSERIALNEKIILSVLLNDESYITKLDKNYFLSSFCKTTFSTIQTLSSKNINITIPTLVIEANDNEISEENLLKVKEYNDYDINQFYYYLNNLKTDYCKHYLASTLLSEVAVEVSRKNVNLSTLKEFNDKLTDTIYIMSGNSLDSKVLEARKLIENYENTLTDRYKFQKFNSSGSSVLDNILTTGFDAGYISILVGRPSQGKSAFKLMLENGMMNKKIPLISINTEMTATSSVDRMLCSQYNIPLKYLYPKGNEEENIHDAVMSVLKELRTKFSKLVAYRYVDADSIDLQEIETLIKDTQNVLNRKGVLDNNYMIVTTDLLTMVSDFTGDNKASCIEDAMNNYNFIMKRRKVHGLGLIQPKRNEKLNIPEFTGYKCFDKYKVNIEELKNSGAFQERARNIFSIHRPYHYAQIHFPDDPELERLDDIAEVQNIKQTSGKVGQVARYLYKGEYFKFTRVEEDI